MREAYKKLTLARHKYRLSGSAEDYDEFMRIKDELEDLILGDNQYFGLVNETD